MEQTERELSNQEIVAMFAQYGITLRDELQEIYTADHEPPQEEFHIDRVLRNHAAQCRALVVGHHETQKPVPATSPRELE